MAGSLFWIAVTTGSLFTAYGKLLLAAQLSFLPMPSPAESYSGSSTKPALLHLRHEEDCLFKL